MNSLLRVAEAAQQLNVCPTTIRRWVRAGKLYVVHLPSGRCRVPRTEISKIVGQEPEAGDAK